MTRAQTTLDFLVGTTVFLLTLSAVFLTVPGLVDPFATGLESNTITADRAAESLVTDVLVSSPSNPYVFTEENVTAFFEGRSESTARTALGLESGADLYIALTYANETAIVAPIGSQPPSSADTSVAWRSGTYRQNATSEVYAELVVKVW